MSNMSELQERAKLLEREANELEQDLMLVTRELEDIYQEIDDLNNAKGETK